MPTGRRSSCSLGFLRNVSGLAGNTHSIFCDGWKQPDTANGCLVLRYAQEPRREAQPRGDEQAKGRTRRSPERNRKSSPNLTETYHGSRHGDWNLQTSDRLRTGVATGVYRERSIEGKVRNAHWPEVVIRQIQTASSLDNRWSSVYHHLQFEGRMSSMAKQHSNGPGSSRERWTCSS